MKRSYKLKNAHECGFVRYSEFIGIYERHG